MWLSSIMKRHGFSILEDCRWKIHDVFMIMGLTYDTHQQTLSNALNMRRITSKFIIQIIE